MLANSFRGTASTFTQPQSCIFLSTGTLESLLYSPLIEHEGTLYLLTLTVINKYIYKIYSITQLSIKLLLLKDILIIFHSYMFRLVSMETSSR